MKSYTVTLEKDGEVFTRNIEASDPGHAQAKARSAYPGAILTQCYWEGHFAGQSRMPVCSINYEVASDKRPEPLESDPPCQQDAFAFLETVATRPRRRRGR